MGRSSLTGTIRFNFGTLYLWDGLPLIPFMIGYLAIAEMINLGTKKQSTIASREVTAGFSSVWQGIKDHQEIIWALILGLFLRTFGCS